MATTLLVTTDTAPTINGLITHTSTGLPVDLTGCQVFFQMRLSNDRRWLINAEATIEDEDAGTVSYDLGADDLDFTGACKARFLVIYPDDRRQHTVPAMDVDVAVE